MLKPYLQRAEQREAGSTQQDDVPGERPQEEKRADSGERAPQDVEEDEIYDMIAHPTHTPLSFSTTKA